MVRTNSGGQADARTYTYLNLWQLCHAHRKRAEQKGENASFQDFLPFQQSFQKAFLS